MSHDSFMENAKTLCVQLIHISLGREMDRETFENFIGNAHHLLQLSFCQRSKEFQQIAFSNLLLHLKNNGASICVTYRTLNKSQRFSPEIKSHFRFVSSLIL